MVWQLGEFEVQYHHFCYLKSMLITMILVTSKVLEKNSPVAWFTSCRTMTMTMYKCVCGGGWWGGWSGWEGGGGSLMAMEKILQGLYKNIKLKDGNWTIKLELFTHNYWKFGFLREMCLWCFVVNSYFICFPRFPQRTFLVTNKILLQINR